MQPYQPTDNKYFDMKSEDHRFCAYTCDNWQDARELMYNLSSWIFRGQGDASWNLATTLERAALYGSCDIRGIPKVEAKTLELFKRRASQYLSNIPGNNNYLEWYSLIQHHGGRPGFWTLLIHSMWHVFLRLKGITKMLPYSVSIDLL